MNQLLRTLFLTATFAAAGSTFAQPATPRVDQREAHQQQRIAQGVASGQLTPRETQRLEAEQARIERTETRAKATAWSPRQSAVTSPTSKTAPAATSPSKSTTANVGTDRVQQHAQAQAGFALQRHPLHGEAAHLGGVCGVVCPIALGGGR